MRILILGGDGMLGHQLLHTLRADHQTHVTLRQTMAAYVHCNVFDPEITHQNVDVRSFDRLKEVFALFCPEAVINCIGLVKQHDSAMNTVANLEVNALLPHRLAELCAAFGARLIHISTDCVFSGLKGMYAETDFPDAHDLYGRTKLLGEVAGPGCLTLRTSFIGRELARKRGLVEWFLAQKGTAKGYRRAVFSGVTTKELSRAIKGIIEKFPEPHGLYHLSAAPIDKYSLLQLMKGHFSSSVNIVPDDTVVIDRSLDSSRFRREFDYDPPSWPKMVACL